MTPAAGVHVKVRAGGETYAVPVDCVREVAELSGLTALPGAGTAFLGVRNVHGQVLPVVDLATALGIPERGDAARVVVAESAGCAAGLAVDEVLDVGELSGARSQPESEFLSEAVLEDGVLVGVIRLERLFSALTGNGRP